MLRIMFAGTPDLSAVILKELLKTKHNIVACLTQPDKPAGRGKKISFSPVKQLAIEKQIPIYQPETLKNEDFQNLLENLNLDIVIVVAYGLIIPKHLLNIPKYGFINIHMSLLPRWRGAAPIQHAILAGDQETGVTIMQMDANLDTGDLLSTASFPIQEQDTSRSLQDQMSSLGALELTKVLENLTDYRKNAKKQVHTKATYAHKIKKSDAKINWQETTAIIMQKIRAYYPYPIAFIEYKDLNIRIWKASILDSNLEKNHAPGTILNTTQNGIDVATKDGIIRLEKIQLPGKKALEVREIIKAKYDLFAPGNIL